MAWQLMLMLQLLTLSACGSSNGSSSSRVVPSSQSRSFWDQINANNEQGKSPSSSELPDRSLFRPAAGSHPEDDDAGDGGRRPASSSSGTSSGGSLRDVLESRQARRNLECRPDFCYRMKAASPGSARVCGSDGKTYESRCMLQFLRRCHGQKVRVRHLGACGSPLMDNDDTLPGKDLRRRGGSADGSGGGRCQEMRLAALNKSSNGQPVIYVPQCNRNGKFRLVQCNYQLNYCFCVRRRSGKPLPGSGVQLPRRPSCRRGRRNRRRKQQKSDARRQKQNQEQNGIDQRNKNNNRRRGRRRKGGRRGSGRKNRCSSRQRAQFNRNILKQFEIEFNASIAYGSAVGAGILKPRGGAGLNGQSLKQADVPALSADWKFAELDTNKDGHLSYRETKALRKVTRANIKPKGCARRFFKTCDLNSNKQLERAEWILCFGLENSKPVTVVASASSSSSATPQSSGGIAAPLVAAVGTAPPDTTSSSSSVRGHQPVAVSAGASGGNNKGSLMELVSRRRQRKRPRKARPFAEKSCPLAREEAMEKNRQLLQLQSGQVSASLKLPATGFGRVFVPECTSDGKYSKRQCHTSSQTASLCFCMDPDSGRVLKGGTGSGATLDCESAHIRARATVSAGFRGCSRPLLRQFANQLTALMVQQTRDAWRPEDGHLSVEARSLKLRFQRADVSRDGRLDRKEQRWWRREIKALWKSDDSSDVNRIQERRRTRKCAANFLRFCNANGDKFVTLAELQACLGLPDS